MTKLGVVLATLAIVGDVRANSPWLKCTLAGGSDGGVEIRVESTRTIDADVHTTLVLKPSSFLPSPVTTEGYWAPVDLATGQRYGAKPAQAPDPSLRPWDCGCAVSRSANVGSTDLVGMAKPDTAGGSSARPL